MTLTFYDAHDTEQEEDNPNHLVAFEDVVYLLQ